MDEKKRRKIIAINLYYIRWGQQLEQRYVQEKTGIMRHQLSNYENGNAIPSLLTAIALADLYDVSIDYITGRTDNPFSHKVPRAPMKYKHEEDQ